jgi:hypothetical protein
MEECITVTCVKCLRKVSVVAGQLTQEGVENYVCEICADPVLERRVEAHENTAGGRTLLID